MSPDQLYQLIHSPSRSHLEERNGFDERNCNGDDSLASLLFAKTNHGSVVVAAVVVVEMMMMMDVVARYKARNSLHW
jgi:hypothetical protein